MKKSTFSILFFVKHTRARKDGTLPIYARITIDGKRAEFSIQQTIDESLWDIGNGQARGNSKLARETNDYIDLVKGKLKHYKLYFEERNEPISALRLRDRYMGIDNNSRTILDIFQEHNDRCTGLMNKDFAPGTVERYIICRKHLEDFIKLKYKRNDFNLNEITPVFISDFEYYLKINRKCCHNTATKYIKNFKKIIRIALANGWMKNDPFANIKFKLDDVDLAFLDNAELSNLMKTEFKVERLQNVKDIYIFCCFTGLAFIDIKNLTYEKLEEIEGSLWLKVKRQKTKNWCRVPLLPPAISIIDKYRSHPYCIKKGLVLPVLTNQKMNAYLKEIADVCGIKKNLSTHTARHTFATTVTLSNKVSMEVVSKMLGHSSINMTKKYARVVDELIGSEMQKVKAKYSE